MFSIVVFVGHLWVHACEILFICTVYWQTTSLLHYILYLSRMKGDDGSIRAKDALPSVLLTPLYLLVFIFHIPSSWIHETQDTSRNCTSMYKFLIILMVSYVNIIVFLRQILGLKDWIINIVSTHTFHLSKINQGFFSSLFLLVSTVTYFSLI